MGEPALKLLDEMLALLPPPRQEQDTEPGHEPDDEPESEEFVNDFMEAQELFQSDSFEECIEAAKYNLTHPTLPQYFQIRNRMLIIAASDEWDEGEKFLLEAEAIYEDVARLTSKSEEAVSALRRICEGLEELRRGMDEDSKWSEEEEAKSKEAEKLVVKKEAKSKGMEVHVVEETTAEHADTGVVDKPLATRLNKKPLTYALGTIASAARAGNPGPSETTPNKKGSIKKPEWKFK